MPLYPGKRVVGTEGGEKGDWKFTGQMENEIC